jgi:succinyl-CoA synthetase alpha subunit
MAILGQELSGILVQGITGSLGEGFARRMVADGTPLLAGVTPGRGGAEICGVPVFDGVAAAVAATGATASLIVVPPPAVADAVCEAASAGVRLVSIYTEHVPVHDALRARASARLFGTVMLGPNSAGIASPGVANMSDVLTASLRPGPVGIVSRSGTLVYEVIDGLDRHDVGVSSLACLGGDEIVGTSYRDLLPLFAADPETRVVVLIGEIGGTAELEAARLWNELGSPKPLVAYVAGWAAPIGKRMGHAGAIVADEQEAAQPKLAVLREVGAVTVDAVTEVADAAVGALSGAGAARY